MAGSKIVMIVATIELLEKMLIRRLLQRYSFRELVERCSRIESVVSRFIELLNI
jgi:hypothetical protein